MAAPAASAPAISRARRIPGLPRPFLLLFLMFFQQSSGCGENGRKCQKQSSNSGAIALGDDSGKRGNKAAEGKADKIFVPLRPAESCDIDFNFHESVQEPVQPQRNPKPKEQCRARGW